MAENITTEKEEIKDYASMKRADLLVLAKKMGAKVNSKTKKADIIAAIEAVEKETATSAEKDLRASTERKRAMKAERREAKAARKEAGRKEEKKKRPSNLLIAILIFGVLIGMFAFITGYNYFNKPASIEAYMEEYGMADMYTDVQYDESSTITVRADDNTVKMLIKLNEDAGDEQIESYKGEDTTEELEELGAGFLTSLKPEVRGFGGAVKVGVKKGDEMINYVKLSYSEAKKIMKKLEKEAEEEPEDTEDAAEEAEDQAEDAAEAAEDATED